MLLAKHVITVYNSCSPQSAGGIPVEPQWQKTLIKFAQWEDSVDRNASNDGHNVIEKHVSIIIPKTADTQGKNYVDYREFETERDKAKLWTIKPNDTRIAYGETPDITSEFTMADLTGGHKTCLVSGFEDFTNQPVMPHWEITAV